MNKDKLKITLLPVVLIAMLVAGSVALASEVTGILTNGAVIIIVSPTADPIADTYTSRQDVVLTAAGATSIRYTIDNTEPDCSTPTIYRDVAIPVDKNLTIKAVSCYLNGVPSSVSTFDYVINLPATPTPTPTPAPAGGGGGGGGGYYSTPTPTPSAGAQKSDTNSDGKVDILDFNTLMVNWGSTGTGNTADLNDDGAVDILDFNLLMVNWTG